MAEFKPGQIVYHKATEKKGVISRKGHLGAGWDVAWDDGTKGRHVQEAELYTEEEYKELKKKESPDKEGSSGGFMAA